MTASESMKMAAFESQRGRVRSSRGLRRRVSAERRVAKELLDGGLGNGDSLPFFWMFPLGKEGGGPSSRASTMRLWMPPLRMG